MSLEEEIAIYQFAQGVHSDSLLLDSFRELDKEEQFSRIFNLYHVLGRPKATPPDIEQATADGSFDPSYTPCIKPNGASSFMAPEGDMTQDYKFLLYVIKAIYQRRFDLDKDDITTWWYQDLSDQDVVQGILARHEALVEELYNSPGYRSEFRALARLQHEHRQERSMQTSQPKDGFRMANKHRFVTYDEIILESAVLIGEPSKYMYAISILHGSLVKGLTRSYRLKQSHVMRVVAAVLERYLGDMYPTGV